MFYGTPISQKYNYNEKIVQLSMPFHICKYLSVHLKISTTHYYSSSQVIPDFEQLRSENERNMKSNNFANGKKRCLNENEDVSEYHLDFNKITSYNVLQFCMTQKLGSNFFSVNNRQNTKCKT